jgi:HD-GYP domain-containing protein (c-di-GMP phosphodiesterase class II)
MSDQRRLTVSDIVIGEPLAWDVYGDDKKLLLRRGQVVQSNHQVETLLQRGLYVEASQVDKAAQARQEAQMQRKEKPSALRFINLANKRLERLLYNLTNEPDAQAKILEVVKALTYAADISSDIAVACILLNQASANYAVRHSVDTALLVQQIARLMHKDADETRSLMAAALTMNIAILRQQDQWQMREGPLSEKEMELVRSHAAEGVNLLKQVGVSDDNWLTLVGMHHDADGSAASQNAKILCFADHYCAAVSTRKYRKSLLPGAALRDVFMTGGKAGDPMLAAYFIKELGTYPPGTCVRLQSGEIGVVTRRSKSAQTPVVHALVGPRGAPLSFPIQRDTTKELYAIREALPADHATLRFSLQQLWGDEAAL